MKSETATGGFINKHGRKIWKKSMLPSLNFRREQQESEQLRIHFISSKINKDKYQKKAEPGNGLRLYEV